MGGPETNRHLDRQDAKEYGTREEVELIVVLLAKVLVLVIAFQQFVPCFVDIIEGRVSAEQRYHKTVVRVRRTRVGGMMQKFKNFSPIDHVLRIAKH